MHTNLSCKFNYQTTKLVKPSAEDEVFKKYKVILGIYKKGNGKLIQGIIIDDSLNVFYEDTYSNCKAVRSYITGYRKNAEVLDYDFGDLIIADLNFDGKEDIALKHDVGGNGGPLYGFYMQDKAGHFYIDHFLTNSVGSFPKYIDPNHKTLTTQIHANVHQEGRKTFKYNSKTKKWHLIKWIMVEDN